MREVLIFHGKPSQERYENPEIPKPHEANWLPWLQSALGRRGVIATIPTFPKPYAPNYEAWKNEIEISSAAVTAIVGHSAGAEFALRLLSENPSIVLNKLVLVAPWNDTSKKYGTFSDYELDADLSTRVKNITVFNSLDDSEAIQQNVDNIMTKLKRAELVEFHNYGHFMTGNKMVNEEFPELLAELTDQL